LLEYVIRPGNEYWEDLSAKVCAPMKCHRLIWRLTPCVMNLIEIMSTSRAETYHKPPSANRGYFPSCSVTHPRSKLVPIRRPPRSSIPSHTVSSDACAEKWDQPTKAPVEHSIRLGSRGK
jgi:hypothetical protein